MERPFRTDAYASEEWVVLVLCKALLLLACVHPVVNMLKKNALTSHDALAAVHEFFQCHRLC